jgi:DNA (cytosine-5)-methyltransferase 1
LSAYYNEHDPFAAAWLRELIKRNLICVGEVDERSIEIVQPDDLRGFTQCHFFAGIGVWSYALRRAGWPDARPVWTGSCPCQPFSDAGKGKGFDDKRHLWPHLFRLIAECCPDVCFGEQVASKDGLAWLDLVSADLEGAGYAVGAADLCAAGIGAPHLRQRLYWLAESESEQRDRYRNARQGRREFANGSGTGDTERPRLERHGRLEQERHPEEREGSERHGAPSGAASSAPSLAHARGIGLEATNLSVRPARQVEAAAVERGAGPWSAAVGIPCADGNDRFLEPGIEPVVDGAPARVGRLRGYGNAIVAEVAETFIASYLDVRGGLT